MEKYGGDNNVSCDTISRFMQLCNQRAAMLVRPIICMDPVFFDTFTIENACKVAPKYFAKQCFSPLTARAMIVPVSTVPGRDGRNTHWELMVVDFVEKEITAFDSLCMNTAEHIYEICVDRFSYSKKIGNTTRFKVIKKDENLPYCYNPNPQISPEILQVAEKILLLYNTYMLYAIKEYKNKCVLLSTNDPYRPFTLRFRNYIEPQINRNCGIYVMGVAYELTQPYVDYKEYIKMIKQFKAGTFLYPLGRLKIENYRSLFYKLLNDRMPQKELHDKLYLCVRCMYRVLNAVTMEGTLNFYEGEQFTFKLLAGTNLDEKSAKKFYKIAVAIENFFNPNISENNHLKISYVTYKRMSIDFCLLETSVNPDLLSTHLSNDMTISVRLSSVKYSSKYKYAIRINQPVEQVAVRYFNDRIPFAIEETEKMKLLKQSQQITNCVYEGYM